MDRHTFPAHGWTFFQPQTNWRAPMPLAMTFDATVEAIIKHRKKNPAITAKHKLATDFDAVATELEVFTHEKIGGV